MSDMCWLKATSCQQTCMAIECKLSKCKDSELILLSVEWNKLKCLIVYPDQLRCIDETMVVAVHALLVVMKLW